MIDFSSAVLKAISDYKTILRKNLSSTQCSAKIKELGIKRGQVKETNEVGLYNLGLKIIAELKKQIVRETNAKKTNNYYQGAREFFTIPRGSIR